LAVGTFDLTDSGTTLSLNSRILTLDESKITISNENSGIDLSEDIARIQMMCDDDSICASSSMEKSKLKRNIRVRVENLKTISNGADCKVI